jgi:CDP-diacylglycerol--glycerol-3-phosphate 3-phosphatidyltransferase
MILDRLKVFQKFNIADWLSFYRIFAFPFLIIFIFLDWRLVFTWALLISYCTDGIDGYLARKFNMTSSRGSQLDSLGDQLTLVAGLIGLWVFEKDFIIENITLIAIPMTLYVLQMCIALVRYGKTTAFHTYLAKLSAIVQAFFILWLLFFGPVYWLFYLVIALGIVETLEEIIMIFMFKNWVKDVKGIYWAMGDNRRHETIKR